MRKIRFNNAAIDGLRATGSDYRVWDTHMPNLNVRVSAKGVKTYYYCYRNSDGRQRWPKIGRANALTVDQARRIARDVQAKVDQGIDPLEEGRKRDEEPTMQTLWDTYLEQHARPKKKASSVKEDERLWRLHLARRFADKKVKKLDIASIRKMHADMRSTPGAANRACALLSKMMSFAVDNEWRADNPCLRVQRYPEKAMERFLTGGETKALWQALAEDDDQCAATIIKVLLLTGARKGEVLKMRWSDLDLASPDPSWTLRAGQQKGERALQSDMVRPLDPVVADLLSEWRRQQAVPSMHWVFPSERKQGAHRTCFKYAWTRIRKTVGIEDVRVHDLRHSFASFAVNSGASLEAIGAALGHKDVRTTKRYAHVSDQSMRGVVSAVSRAIESAG